MREHISFAYRLQRRVSMYLVLSVSFDHNRSSRSLLRLLHHSSRLFESAPNGRSTCGIGTFVKVNIKSVIVFNGFEKCFDEVSILFMFLHTNKY